MTRTRHSYVPFYMDDWAAATAHMPRPVWSVLFQICQYNWDKAEPVPQARLKIMVADLDGQGEQIINLLIESGSLEVDERGIYSARALREAERALDLWQRKSRGGRKTQSGEDGDKSGRDSGTLPRELEESSRTPAAEPEPEPEPDKEEEKGRPDLPPKLGLADVANAWNDMASKNGLAQIKHMTQERSKRMGARIEEHGAEAIIAAILTIPEVPFLMGGGERGWKANFDWLCVPNNCAKLLEGGYAQGSGKRSGWVGD